ncbi:MAG: riboflavin kinase [Patescibacteria group bacterium]|nr:riboflavin kinase [Patescibacteria group bacterium]
MIIQGPVIKGDGQGKKQGFPTANLNPNLAKNIEPGVYACFAFLKKEKYPAILIFGALDKNNCSKLEVFFLKNCPDIYGQKIKVKIIKKIRPLIKFYSKRKLYQQVKKDIKKNKEILLNYLDK